MKIKGYRRFLLSCLTRTSRFWPNKLYLRMRYWICLGKRLNLKNPKDFNEKLQWLKLYDHNPLYTTLVDKVLVKDYVADIIGTEHIIPTLGVWDSPEDIEFDKLPNQFVLKCNHNSGIGLFICKDKSKVTAEKWNSVKVKLARGLKQNYFWLGREWPYKDVKPRIIAEKFMTDESGLDLKDYKLFCFNGNVQFCKVDFDRFTDHHANYYSPDWSLLPFGEADYAPNPDKKGHPTFRVIRQS